MMGGHYDQFNWWWYVIMPLGMIGFWAIVAWAVVTVVRADRHDSSSPPASGPAQILAERYARGDIDAEDYHRRLHDLHATDAARQ